MKKILILLSILVIPILIYAGVSGTPHDFSDKIGANNDNMTACGGCHKPHNAGTLIPLWNDNNTFDGTYNKYVSPTDALNVNNTEFPETITGTISEACMACHDGMVESLQSPSIDAKLDYSTTNSAYKGQHPVHIKYLDETTLANNNRSVETSLKALATAEGAGIKFYGDSNDMVECGSCHDPHNNTNGAFLRVDKANLCQTCHNN